MLCQISFTALSRMSVEIKHLAVSLQIACPASETLGSGSRPPSDTQPQGTAPRILLSY